MIRPLQTYKIISIVAFSLLLVAFLLLILVGLSLTIIKPIYLLVLHATAPPSPPTSIATELRFGVWGVCATSVLNSPTLLTNEGLCIGPQLGYDVPASVRELSGIPDSAIDAVEKALLIILVLHPISAALTFITFGFSLFLHSHPFSIVTLFLAILAGILSTVVLGVDLALVIVARSQVRNLPFKLDIKFGNAVWMVLTAVLLIWIAVGFLSARACYCCGVRRKPVKETQRF